MRKINIRPPVPTVEQHGGRLLIARQQRPPAPYDGARAKRIAKACTNCRKRKTKCTGESPTCVECQTNNLPCVYEHGRRDRVKDLTSHKELLLALVRDLATSVGDADKAKIKDVLHEINEDSNLPSPRDIHTHMEDVAESSVTTQEFSGSASTHYATSDRGPETRHSLDEESHPEIALLREGDSNASPTQPRAPNPASNRFTSDVTLWLGDRDVEVDNLVHPYDLPSFDEASTLLHLYLDTVHDWLPLLPVCFEDQMRRYYEHPTPVSSRWKATLNLVFAIAARYRHLTPRTGDSNGSRGEEDVTYMSRAMQLLAVDSNAILTSNPDLPLIQALGLLSLYYLSAGHVHRAWSTASIALRLSIVLNLHLKNDSPKVWYSRIDAESLAWWSLRSLDTLLSSITGRPLAISDRDCNLSLPRTFSLSETRQRSTVFLQTNLKITIVAQWALSSLYSISAAELPLRILQEHIIKLTAELQMLLPAIQDRERLILHFNWFYTMILVTRPCLRHIATHSQDDPSTSAEVFELSQQCIRAAHSLVSLFPEQPSASIFRNGPWWCMTHYIMQAMDVLILALPSPTSESRAADSSIPQSIKKLVRWLQWMQPKDVMAQRALAAVLDSRRRAGDDTYADLFEEDTPELYSEYALPRWDLGLGVGTGPTQFLNDAGGLEDLVSTIEPPSAFHAAQPQPGFLPMPPGYHNSFPNSQDMWNW